MSPDYTNTISFSSHVRNLSIAEGLIEALSADGYINEAVFGNVMVAVNEAVLNAMNHGNAGDAIKMVTMTVSIAKDELTLEVSDEGSGFDFENLPDPTAPENLEKTSGRGIFIIRNLSDEVTFEDEGARLIMNFSLAVPAMVEA